MDDPQVKIHFQANFIPDRKEFCVVLESLEDEQKRELRLTGDEYKTFVAGLQERKNVDFHAGQGIEFIDVLPDGMRLAFSDGVSRIKFSCDSRGYSKMLEYFELILEQYIVSKYNS